MAASFAPTAAASSAGPWHPDCGIKPTAEQLFLQAQKAGQVNATYELGVLYELRQDFEAAAQRFQLAHEAGHVNATQRLGIAYTKGHGVEQDYKKAAELFQQAHDETNGYGMGWILLGPSGDE